MSFDVILRQLLEGFGQTCLIFALTLVFPCRWHAGLFWQGQQDQTGELDCENLYFHYARNAPDAAADDLVLCSVLFVGMPIGGYKFTAVILGCSMNYAAYFAEIYRSGIEAIPIGQYEAAQLLGYDKRRHL